MAYEYITENNLYERQNYMYSEYRGMEFLKDYLDSRHKYTESHIIGGGGYLCPVESIDDPTQQDFMIILQKLKAGDCSKEIVEKVNAYTKSFEVRKRIYSSYSELWKPEKNANFENYQSYLLFADCLLYMYQYMGCLKYFNCLLKLNDTLLSIQDFLPDNLQEYFYGIISREVDVFHQLAHENETDVEAGR